MLGSTFFKLFPKSIKNTCVLSIYIGIWFTISIILFIITGAVKTIDETNNIINLKENISKNKVILPIKKGKYVYEFPINTISKYNLKLNDKIKVTE